MYKVFTGDGRQYVGCSEALANDFFDAAVKTGRCVMMMRRTGMFLIFGVLKEEWEEVKEHIA